MGKAKMSMFWGRCMCKRGLVRFKLIIFFFVFIFSYQKERKTTTNKQTGISFKVGTGLSDEQRQNPPAVGSVINVRYTEILKSGKPRFPVYNGIRIDVLPWVVGSFG